MTENLKRYTLLLLLFCVFQVTQGTEQDSVSVVQSEYSISTANHYKAEASFYGSPLVTEKLIVIGNHDKHVYFFNHDGELLHKFKTEGFIHATAEQLSNGNIVIGSYDRHLYFFDENGNYLKRLKLGGRIFTNVVETIQGELAFGLNNSIIILDEINESIQKIRTRALVHGSINRFSNGDIAIGSTGKKMLFISSTGEIVSKYKAHGWILHSKPVELSNGLLAFGAYDNHLHFTTQSGNPIAKINIGGRVHSTPIETVNGEIVCGAFDGILYFISMSKGIVNEFITNGKIVASPTLLADGNIAIGSYDQHLYIISPEGKELAKYNTQGKIFSSPKTFNKNHVVCATTKGDVYFLKIETLDAKSKH
jgi:outer membrane protein assembly factor BamB